MNKEIHDLFLQSIAGGLQRRSVTTCGRWAEKYRTINSAPWNFKRFPWLRPMHDSNTEINIGQKAAQMGFTEWAMNMTFYKIDMCNTDCLYILPSDGDASDFSSGRFDPALEASKHLRDLFSDVKNVGHKRAGQYNLYVRGSRSRSKLKSIPCGFIVFDEVDEMAQQNIPLAMERASGQMIKQFLFISTPTIQNFGINKLYRDSTQEHFFFKCPHCSRFTELIYPDCIEVTGDSLTDQTLNKSFLKCKECKHVLDHNTKPEWLADSQFIPTYADRDSRGFTVSQLYSTTVTPAMLAISVVKARSDPTEATELYNSKLALPYEAEGAKVTESNILSCLGTHLMGTGHGLITMGVDVGADLHIEIDEWHRVESLSNDINDKFAPKVLWAGTRKKFEELTELVRDYSVVFGVIDRYPETREAFRFATQYLGRILLCIYGRGIYGKQLQLGSEAEHTVLVDRTSWLDLALGRFRNNTITLPRNLPLDYNSHIKTPTRIYERDALGNPVGRYESGSDDHYAHARLYAELALPFAVGIGEAHDVGRIY